MRWSMQKRRFTRRYSRRSYNSAPVSGSRKGPLVYPFKWLPSARVSGQDRKKLPALGTNQIEGFGGFRPVASLDKNYSLYCQKIKVLIFCYILVAYTLDKNIRTLKINLVKLQMNDKILRRNYLILCLKTDLSIYTRCQKSFGINLAEVTLFFLVSFCADNIFILLCGW